MADQASFDKPDTGSNYSNEVLETLRANIRAAAALQPGSRTNPGVGALFRSAPAAGELLLEEATNAAGTTKATVFDSRTKLSTSGGTVSGQTVLRNGDGTYSLRVESVTTGAGIRYRTQDSGGSRRVAVDFTNDGSGITSDVQVFEGDRVGFGGRPDASARVHLWSGGTGNFRALFGDAASSGNGAPGGWATAESLGARGDGNGSFFGRFGAAFRRTDGTAIANGTVVGGYLFGGQHGTASNFASGSLRYAAGIFGVARGSFTGAGAMPIAVVIRTGSVGDDILAANGNYGTDAVEYSEVGDMRLLRAAPKLAHRTGGQDVSELAFAVAGGGGTVTIRTRDTAGANAFDALSCLRNLTRLQHFSATLGTAQVEVSDGVVYLVSANGSASVGSASLAPLADNANSCGRSGFRWSAVWAANGTIQTSDSRDKTEVEPIDAAKAHAFLMALSPVTFRWIVGGSKVERVVDHYDEREIEVTEQFDAIELQPVVKKVKRTEKREQLDVVDDRAVVRLVEIEVDVDEPQGSWIDVTDENGQPVMVQVGERKVKRGSKERIVPVMEPRKHFVPQLEQVSVKRERVVKKLERVPVYRDDVIKLEGRRFHAGFLAQEVRDALREAGLDRDGQALGLWVQDEAQNPESRQSLRPDQFLPLIVAAYRYLALKISALEAAA